MIALVSGLQLEVGRFPALLRGVGVLAMPDVELYTMQDDEAVCDLPPGIGVLMLLACGKSGGVIIDRGCIVDRMEVTYCVISATCKLISADDGVEF